MKLTPEQAFTHTIALIPPIVAITGTSDGYSHGWTEMPQLSHCRKLWTAEGKGQCYCIGHDNIQWPAGDIAKRIYVPEVVPTDEDARQRPWVMVRDGFDAQWIGPHKLLGVRTRGGLPFVTDRHVYGGCRFATPAEIATVEAKP